VTKITTERGRFEKNRAKLVTVRAPKPGQNVARAWTKPGKQATKRGGFFGSASNRGRNTNEKSWADASIGSVPIDGGFANAGLERGRGRFSRFAVGGKRPLFQE